MRERGGGGGGGEGGENEAVNGGRCAAVGATVRGELEDAVVK